MFDKFILLGTSHTLPEFNSMQTVFKENFNIPFDNYAVSSLGIDTYFSRMHTIFENNKNKKLSFIAEIPCPGRYFEFYHNNNLQYKEWQMQKKEFWGIHGETSTVRPGDYGLYMTYYNVAKLFNDNKTLIDKASTRALLKVKTMSDKRMEDEHILSQVLALNSFAKHLGHDINWFSFNNHIIKEAKVKEDFETYDVNLITSDVLEDSICKKYGINDTVEIKKNKEIYPDGSHLTRMDWKFLAEKYFVKYYIDKKIK